MDDGRRRGHPRPPDLGQRRLRLPRGRPAHHGPHRSPMRRTRCCDRGPPELSRRGRLRPPRDGSDRRRGPHRHDLPVGRAVGIRRRARHDAVAPRPARQAGQPGRDAAGLRGGGRRRGRRGGPEPRGARAGRVPRRRGPGARPRRRHRGDRRPGLPRRRHAGAAERAGRRHPRRRDDRRPHRAAGDRGLPGRGRRRPRAGAGRHRSCCTATTPPPSRTPARCGPPSSRRASRSPRWPRCSRRGCL